MLLSSFLKLTLEKQLLFLITNPLPFVVVTEMPLKMFKNRSLIIFSPLCDFFAFGFP